MKLIISKYDLLFVVLASSQVCLGQVAAQQELVPSRETIVAALRHQEALLRSVECRFEVVYEPTSATMLQHIRTLQGEKGIKRYQYTEQVARKQSHAALWWRKGPKERLEITPLFSEGKGVATHVFDGIVVRTLEQGRAGGPKKARLETVEKTDWGTGIHIHPFSMLYEVAADLPYSKLITEAQEFNAVYQYAKGQRYLHVSIRHPKLGNATKDILFDDSHKIIEHQVRRENDLGGRTRVYSRWKFGLYEAHRDASGEMIWFPNEAMQHLYMGALPDGTLVEYMRKKVNIKDIKFNVDIPEERFTLDLPKDAEIYDGVTGQGFLPAGTDLASWTKPPLPAGQRSLWLWIAIVVVCIVLATLLGWFWARRRGVQSA